MPSRKKVKGKARKAAKEAKVKAEEEENQAMLMDLAELGNITMGELFQRHELRRTATQTCQHGIPPLSHSDKKICDEFINAFRAALLSRDNVTENGTA